MTPDPFIIRHRLATIFPGAFLLQKRCRCTLHLAGPEGDPNARVLGVEICPRCRRYGWYRTKMGAAA